MNKRIKKKRNLQAKLYKKIIGKKLRKILRDNSLYPLPINLRDDEYYMTFFRTDIYKVETQILSVPINYCQRRNILRYQGKKYPSYLSFNDRTRIIDISESGRSMLIHIIEFPLRTTIRCSIFESPFNDLNTIKNTIPLMIDINHLDLSLLRDYDSFKEYLLKFRAEENLNE